jgi:hypothetical protein
MKTFLSWLFRYDLFFDGSVRYSARLDASELRQIQLLSNQVLTNDQRIKTLAQQRAEQFYQSGFITILVIRLRASRVGTRQQVTETYSTAFLDSYTYTLNRE